MAEVTSGLRSLLSLALPYVLFQRAVGARRIYEILLERARIRPGDRVLDLGSGTSEILAYLPDVDYVGVEPNGEYVEAARDRYGARGRFLKKRAGEISADELGEFDRVLVIGVLHHLDDGEARHMLSAARGSLAPGGRLTSLDPCLTEPQSRLTRWVFHFDRGRNIRSEAGYLDLACPSFARIETFVYENALRIPYTHLIMICGPNAGGEK